MFTYCESYTLIPILRATVTAKVITDQRMRLRQNI